MRSDDNGCNKFLRVIGGAFVVASGILSTLGSVGNGGSNSGSATPSGATPSSITAFNFTADNTDTATRIAASAISFFPAFTTISQQILSTISITDPGNSPFDLEVCANTGDSILTWIDSDHSGNLTTGDTASLQFENCDMSGDGVITGTVKLGITSVEADPLPNSIGFNAATNLTILNAQDTTILNANFRQISSTQDNIEFTNVYSANDTSNQKLVVTQNDHSKFEFGCFNVTETLSVANDAGDFSLSVSGIINASESIMSLAVGPQLSFINSELESGTQRLLSMSSPNCATLGVPDGVGDTDGSYIDMDAVGGGKVRLHTYDGKGIEVKFSDNTWNSLLD